MSLRLPICRRCYKRRFWGLFFFLPPIVVMAVAFASGYMWWAVGGFVAFLLITIVVAVAKPFHVAWFSDGIQFRNKEYQRLFEEANPAHFRGKEFTQFKPPSTLFPE